MRRLIAVLALCAAQTALAQSGTWSGGAGLQYSSGDYGTGTDTDLLAVPFLLRYDSDPWTLKLVLPWYRISGSTGVIPGLGAVDRSNRRGTSSAAGFGDLSVSATHATYSNRDSGLGVDFTGKVKLPTGEEDKGLSSGSTDFTAQVDAYKRIDQVTVFGGLGYTVFVGGFLDLRDAASYTLGASRRFDADTFGVSLDGRTRVAGYAEEQRELIGFWSRPLDGRTKLQAHVLLGLANGSPVWGAGVMLLRSF